MWNSPLEKIYGDIHSQMVKQDEENMIYTVRQAFGYSVDKNELLKALQYDREQYKKGYDDAMCVIEDIRAEIDERITGGSHCDEWIDGFESGLTTALEIIDKHIKGVSE